MSAPQFEVKNMPFRRFGSSGLRVSLFSLGGWLTLGGSITGDPVKEIIKTAFDNGINTFDTAESYSGGKSEIEMGRVIKELGFRRSDLVISTKIFWGTRKGPNDAGLSRKHIIEGAKESLARLQLDYVDVILAHRCDPNVPMEEIVRAFNFLIDKGLAFYWGTSEWTAREIEQAFHVATRFGLAAPVIEQTRYNLLNRLRPEQEYGPIFKQYGTGMMAFSALFGGVLTGKYNEGIPEGSRYATHAMFKPHIAHLETDEGKEKIRKVKELTKFAETELGTTISALSIAWVARNPDTSTVLLGASSNEQLLENLKALDIIPKLTPEVMQKIEEIVQTKPPALDTYSRPPLDPFGRA